MRGLIDRFIGVVARLAVGFFFRSVEIEGFDRIPRDRPVLLVANHFNGLVDPVLLAAVAPPPPLHGQEHALEGRPGPPRPGLRRHPARLPGRRWLDRRQRHHVARVLDDLADGEMVAIFPEGTTHDEPRLAPVRTGAARIAAMAWSAGDTEMVILPVGLTYEDKVATRSRALIQAGAPLDRAVLGRSVAVEDHDAVNELTGRIGQALAELSPDFDSLMQAGALGEAAEISLRDTTGRTAGGSHSRIASAWPASSANRPAAEQAELIDRTARYHLALALARVTDLRYRRSRRPTPWSAGSPGSWSSPSCCSRSLWPGC